MLIALALTASSLVVAGCSRKADPTGTAFAAIRPGSVTRGGTLRINFRADNTSLVSLDPFQVYWIEHRVLLRNLAESLTDQDPSTGQMIPWLAKSWKISGDGLSYTFVLRNDVTFSNGTRLDARAVKTAFDANKAFAASVPGTFGATYLAGYDHAELLDDETVKLVLSHPNGGFLQATSTTNLAILAPESYAHTPKERSLGAIIGTGPFVLQSYTPEVGATLVRRSGYAWPSAAASNRGEAYLDGIEVHYVPEESVRNGQFLQGRVDLVWPRDPFRQVDVELFERNHAQILTRSLPGPALNLYPNASAGKILADGRVRESVQKAIDRATYAHTVFSASFPVVESLYDTTTPFFKSEKDRLGYDPDGASRLLDEAAGKKADDGWRYKDGARLTLVRLLFQAETPGDVLVQDQLRRVGIELKLRVLVAGEYQAAIAAGKYDLSASYMTRADPVVLQTFLDPRYTNHSALSVNAYSPATLERAEQLFDDGLQATAAPARSAAYAELQDVLISDNVAFPVYERIWQVAASPRVQGFHWTSEAFALFNDIWLATP
ncbi:MAG: ABC transporter substrate-binding protein [Polyangiaceae bacterium]